MKISTIEGATSGDVMGMVVHLNLVNNVRKKISARNRSLYDIATVKDQFVERRKIFLLYTLLKLFYTVHYMAFQLLETVCCKKKNIIALFTSKTSYNQSLSCMMSKVLSFRCTSFLFRFPDFRLPSLFWNCINHFIC